MHLVEEVAEYYDALAHDYHRRFGFCRENDAEDYKQISCLISEMFAGRDVLEIACGTGYWTEMVSKSARSVMATDVNGSMIMEARKLLSGRSNVRFQEADAYSLESIPNEFSGAISVLWWCHVPRGRIRGFLKTLHSKLKPGSGVLHVCQLEDLDAQNHELDSDGNAIALRKADSRVFQVVKNIPTEQELRNTLSEFAREIRYSRYTDSGLWSAAYSIR